MQNLEKYAINFFWWVGIQVLEPGNYVLWGWKVDKYVWIYGVSKCMGKLIVKLKAIKYKKDSSCYLSF